MWGVQKFLSRPVLAQFHFCLLFYEKGEGTVLLALTDAPELNIPSWCPEGGAIRYRCFFDVRDRSNITTMKLFAWCPAPGGTQYMELFFLFLWVATCLWKKEINMLYEQFSSPAGHRDLRAHPPLLPLSPPSCPCHLSSVWSTSMCLQS